MELFGIFLQAAPFASSFRCHTHLIAAHQVSSFNIGITLVLANPVNDVSATAVKAKQSAPVLNAFLMTLLIDEVAPTV